MLVVALIFLCVLLLFVLVLVIASLYFYNLVIARRPKTFLAASPDLVHNQSTELVTFDVSWLDQHNFEEVEIKSYDGLLLRGYYLAAPEPTMKTALLAHGYAGSARTDMGAFAKMYHERLGYNVLMTDGRGHGASEGKYIGFGWPDRLDYLKWLHFLLQKVGSDAQIVLHGISMGGASMLMTSGERLPEQVKCIISDSAYTSVKAILSYQCRRLYKLPPVPLVYLVSLICKIRAGYSFGEASALRQVRKASKPVLFIHGADDTFVPVRMLEPLYEACPVYKEQFIVPKAGHGLSYAADVPGYRKKVADFVGQFIS
ncbi:MAG TPA: alpha/beta hydrolase [Ktedonobacteraceae bacterium]